jgi:hypothetical protein
MFDYLGSIKGSFGRESWTSVARKRRGDAENCDDKHKGPHVAGSDLDQFSLLNEAGLLSASDANCIVGDLLNCIHSAYDLM